MPNMLTRAHSRTGKSSSRAINIWRVMKQRCLNPNNPAYDRYGGRGIVICERWLRFDNFLADMGEPPERLTLDRIDNDGDYSPENCRWATGSEQANNRRSSRYIEHNGEVHTLAEWSRLTQVDYKTLHMRLKRGWTLARALTPHKGSLFT